MFSFKRRFHNKAYYLLVSWMKGNNDLREPGPSPLGLSWQLKPGFYWEEFIH